MLAKDWLDAVETAITVQQKLMRHSDIRTTMSIYGDVVTYEMVLATIRNVTELALKPVDFSARGGAEEGMPWKESSVMDEWMRFVIRRKDGESMASLCREFGISRKTGYKILERFEHCGVEGLSDRARRPHRYANQLPAPVEAAIMAAKQEKPHWGARKIYELLLRRLPSHVKVPARSTIHAIRSRHVGSSPDERSRHSSSGDCCG